MNGYQRKIPHRSSQSIGAKPDQVDLRIRTTIGSAVGESLEVGLAGNPDLAETDGPVALGGVERNRPSFV